MEKEVLQPRGLFEPELWEQELIESDAGKRGSSTTWPVWIGIMRTRTNWVNVRGKGSSTTSPVWIGIIRTRTNWVNDREKNVLQPRGLVESELLWEQELIESDAGKRGFSTTLPVWIGIMRTRTNWVNGREKEVLQPRGLVESELWEQELIKSASWKRRFFNHVACLNRNYENKN